MTKEQIKLEISLEVKEALEDLASTSGGLKSLMNEAKPAGAAMKKLEKEIKDTAKTAKEFAQSAAKVGKNLSLYVTAPILAAGTAAVKAAADFEKQQKAFEVLLGSAKEGADLFKELKDFSASTPLQLGDITSAAQKLLAFGTASEDITDELRRLGDLAQGDSQKLSTLTDAYGKLQAKGRASLEEINRFTENGVPLMDALSQSLGVTTEELFKMVSQGKIGFEDVQTAIAGLTDEGGQFQGLMEEMSQTTAGRFSTALDNVKLAAAELGAELLPVANDILDKITSAAKGFAQLDTATQQTILMVGALAAAVGPAISGISALTTAFAFLAANPVVAVVGGLAAVTTGLIGLGRARRQAQLKELEKEFKDVADSTGLSVKEIEAIERSLSRGSFDVGANAGRDVRELAESLGLSHEAVIAVGLASEDVSEEYRGQLKTLDDQIKKQIELNAYMSYADAARRRSAIDRAERERKEAEAAAKDAEIKKEIEDAEKRIHAYGRLIANLDMEAAGAGQRKLDLLNKQLSLRQNILETLEDAATADGVIDPEELAAIVFARGVVNDLSGEVEEFKKTLDGTEQSAGELFDELNKSRAIDASLTGSRIDDLELERDRALSTFEGTEDQKLRLAQKYSRQIADLEIEEAKRAAREREEAMRKAFETAREAAKDDGRYIEYAAKTLEEKASSTEIGQMAGFAGGQAADPMAMAIDALADFVLSIENVQKILNPFETILEGARPLLEFMINDALQPFVDFLTEIGEVLGQILAPFISILSAQFRVLGGVLQLIMIPVRLVGQAFAWLNDKVIVPFGNAVIDLINGVIKALNKIPFVDIDYVKRLKTTSEIADREELIKKRMDQINDEMDQVRQTFEDNRKEIEDAYQKNVESLRRLLTIGAMGEAEYDQQVATLNEQMEAAILAEKKIQEDQLDRLDKILTVLQGGEMPDSSDYQSSADEAAAASTSTGMPTNEEVAGGTVTGLVTGAAIGAGIGSVVPVIGTSIGAAAGGIIGGVAGFGSSLGWWDVGAVELPHDTMGMAHKGEMIVPATFAEGVRRGDISIGKNSSSREGSSRENYYITVKVAGSVQTEERLVDSIMKGISKKKKRGNLPAESREVFA